MKQTLYQINSNHAELIKRLEEKDFVLDPEDEEALAISAQELAVKSVSYLEVIRTKELLVTYAESEIKRIQSLAKREQRTIDRLKESLLKAVEIHGAFEVGLTKFGVKTSKQTVVEQAYVNSLPSELKSVTVTEKPKLKEIKAKLDAGEEIEGCSIKTNYSLKIN